MPTMRSMAALSASVWGMNITAPIVVIELLFDKQGHLKDH